MDTSFTKIIFLLLIFCRLSHWGYAQSWQGLGPDISGKVSDTNGTFARIAVDAHDSPIVAYTDIPSFKATVRKYNGTSWVTVGAPDFTAGEAFYTSLALDATGTPFVAYRDGGNGKKATVKKYNGSSWVDVGTAGFSAGEAWETRIAVDVQGTPFVAYQDRANGNKATLMKYTGSSWIPVGAAGFTAGEAGDISLALDAQGVPFVAYQDKANGSKVAVRKFTGGSWVNVGPAAVSTGEARYTSVALDAAGTPFVAYIDVANGNEATVKKYNGSSWVDVGPARISGGAAVYTSLALDGAGTPALAFCNRGDYRPVVKKFTGSSWATIGYGFPAGQAYDITLALDASGAPLIAFEHYTGGVAGKAAVMKFVAPPLAITTQPVAASIDGGQHTSFTVAATGGSVLTYQWQVSQDGGASFSNIANGLGYSGATTASLTLTKVPISRNGYQYRVQVRDGVVVTSNAVPLTVHVPAFDNTRAWQVAGAAGLSAGAADFISLALDASGTPYAAYRDGANGYKATVSKFTGGSWVDVGPAGFSAGWAYPTGLAFEANGNPMVAFTDEANGSKVTVKRFTGSSWVDVGPAGFSAGMANYINLALDGSGIPYVAYVDGANGRKVSVKKYTGSSWVYVGTAGFSAGEVNFTSLVLDAAGTPFVAYKDAAHGNKATVMKFTGSSWVAVGGAGFSAGGADWPSLALDAAGTPFVAYQDETQDNKVTVKKLTGTSWADVGAAGAAGWGSSLMGLYAYYPLDLALDAAGTPFVAFRDGVKGSKVTVKRFTGSSWVEVGTAGFSAGATEYLSLALDAAGVPFVAYRDEANGNKATVMKFAAPPIIITTQPVSATIDGGQHTSFTVAATGGALTYQWQVSRDGGASFSNITNGLGYSGATTATLTLTNAPISMNGYRYRVQVSNSFVGTSNAVDLTVNVPAFDNTRTWQIVGTGGVSAGRSYFTKLVLDASGTPYVAYRDRDETFNSRAMVKKYSGSSWVEVGDAGFSPGVTNYISLAMDAAGTPFVAYQDEANDYKAMVRKYSGSSWIDVGTAGFSLGQANATSLALDASGTPFVVYRDGANDSKATVRKYTGSSWVDVGTAGFSAARAGYTCLALDASGTPYVAYQDGANGYKITVKKFSGSSWVDVGTAGFSAGGVGYISAGGDGFISLALDAAGVPYVAFPDQTKGNKVTVMKFSGSSWVDVGTAGFSAGQAYATSLVLDASGTPFVAYQDGANGYKITVKKFSGSSWVDVGTAGFSAGGASQISLALDADGTPFVAYSDDINGYKATVMKLAAPPVSAPLPTITTGILSAATYCAGASLPVPFSTTGTFEAPNTFTAQLSDAAGSFAAPTIIGSGIVSPLSAAIPAHVAPGTGYRIRIVGAAPLVAGTDNGVNLSISSTAAQPGIIAGATSICPGETGITYTVNPVSEATSYTWTVPADWQIMAGQGTPSITVATGSAAGDVSVTADNACGQSSARTLAVAVTPVVGGNSITADQAICLGSAPEALLGSLPTRGNSTITYFWESSTTSATAGFAPAPGVNTGKDYTPGTGLNATSWFRRRVMAGSCPATATYSNAIKITVLAPPAMPTALPVSQCGPGPVTLTATGGESSGSYRWYPTAAGGTAIANETGATYTTPVLTATTTYYVAAVNPAGCESDRRAVTVTINTVPQVIAGAPVSVCGEAADLTLTGFSPAGGSWSGPGVSGGIFNASQAGVGAHVLTYSYTDAGGCTTSASREITVTACSEEADWFPYPNPSSGKIKVELSVAVKTDLVFRVLRLDGSLVLEKTFLQVVGEFSQVFDIGGSAKGLYLLHQISDKGIITKQFVIQ